MAIKDILAPVLDLEGDSCALEAAETVAVAFEAHVAALIVAVHPSSTYAEHAAPLSEVLLDLAKGARSAAALKRQKIVDWIERVRTAFEVRDLSVEDAAGAGEVVAHARLADLVVMSRAPGRARQAIFERILFIAGRPVLAVAPGSGPLQVQRVLIGWNASNEAMRAVTAALPLLQRASAVFIATVDAAPSKLGHGQAPGCELAAHLARHGVQTQVHNLDGAGRSDGAALLDCAVAESADLVVLGAYGRTRASEFLFGGVTREVLHRPTPPLLLSH